MTPLSELLGECPEIQAVRETVRRLLAHGTQGRRLPALLILGETGTGKGLLVRALHRAGPRAAGPLVEVNCAAIPETLLEAELFGFERGAFTDARQPKPGLFQTAHGGILFLDEVGLLPERVQAKFLKVLEDGAVRRLGSTQSEPADVAITAATSEDLLEAVRGRRFREDLYHRLAVVTLRLPSLAERGPDILLLAQHFLARACADYGLAPKTLTPDARAALLAYPWPGNIRELANVMERAALLTKTPLMTAEALGLPATPGLAGTAPEPRARPRPLRDARGAVEREYLIEALDETHWNIARAAARLQIPRGTLRYRIEKLGLQRSEPSPPRAGPATGLRIRNPATVPSPPGGSGARGAALGTAPARVPARGPGAPVGHGRRARHRPGLRGPRREGGELRRTRRGTRPDGGGRGLRARADRGCPAAGGPRRRGDPEGGRAHPVHHGRAYRRADRDPLEPGPGGAGGGDHRGRR
jgi:DNA-binding NtrC family response regulator